MIKRAVTITDVAKKVGVSTATISRYLNGKYEYMSLQSKKRIKEAIEELGYRPSKLARNLKMQHTRMIGFVLADIANPFSSILAKGIDDACRSAGYIMSIANTNEDPAEERIAIRTMIDERVEGIIVHNCGENNTFFTRLAEKGAPIVLAERPIGSPPIFDTVQTNDVQSICEMIKNIRKIGYDHVAYFSSRLKYLDSRIRRSRAYHEYYPEIFGEEPLEYILTSYNIKFIEGLLEAFMKQPGKKAVLTNNGVTTLHVLKAIKALSYTYPENIGLVSFDDWEWMKIAGLTAISQPAYDVGIQCVNRLLQRINQPNMKCEIKELACSLIFRDSL